MNNPTYVPLFNSTSLSKNTILNSENIIAHAVKNQLEMIGICERMNFFSMLEFAKLAKKNKIKPVFGCVINLLWQDKIFGDLICFMKNQKGFEYFSKVLSDAYINQRFIKENCYLQLEDLWDSQDIIMVIPKNNSFHQNIINNEVENCQDFLIQLKEKIGNNLYLAMDLIEETHSFPHKLIPLADSLSIPLVYYHGPLFPSSEARLSYYIFDCIINKKQYDEDIFQNIDENINSLLQQEIIKEKAVMEEALLNTYYLALRCNFMPKKTIPKPPYFIADPEVEKLALRNQATEGLTKLIQDIEQSKQVPYFARLKMELEVIISKEFAGYFLIVADFVQWAKKNEIPVGAGRGSGAGSIVAWSLGITEVDPLQFDLLFERFLNPERASMPDFDIDFCPKRRDEVLKYVINKYGIYHCAHIITFGLMKAKMVVRDVGRVLGMSYYDVDKIAKIIPNDQIRPVKLADVLKNDHRLQIIYQEEEKIKKLIDISLTLEGLPRNISIHAAGFIISNENLYTYAPFYVDREEGQLCLQLNKYQVEDVGLIKFDFLCLKTLTICQEIKEMVLSNRQEVVNLDNSDLKDPKAYELMGTGLCSGIFQLESSGIQEEVVQMKPDHINDIIALISLFRPGPIGHISKYIRCKHGLEEVNYSHPILQSILQNTYGVIVYQEQVMEITRVMAGYSLSRADIVRKAMGQKKAEEMVKQKMEFLEGSVKNGIPLAIAQDTFELISLFAGYAFNKAHAASYAIISYHTAYLKAHYMEEFYTVILNNDINDSSKILTFILEFRKFNGIVEAPVINKSPDLFMVSGEKTILYGLTAIRGVGNYGKKIYQERLDRGEYKSYQDFLYRNREINKKVLKALVYSGAFDIFDKNRCKIMTIGEIFLETKFAVVNTMDKRKWSVQRTILHEQEAFGFFLKANPINVYGQILKSKQIESIGKLLESLNNKNEVVMRCAGILEGVKKRKTPTGIPYAFLSIMDGHHNMELTAFSKVLTEKYDILVENNLIIFTIHGRKEREKLRFSVRDLQSIEQFLSNTNYSLYIKTDGDDSNIQSVVDLLIRENQSSNQKNVDVIFAGNYMQYHLSHFLSHSVSFTEQLDSLGLIYNYGL